MTERTLGSQEGPLSRMTTSLKSCRVLLTSWVILTFLDLSFLTDKKLFMVSLNSFEDLTNIKALTLGLEHRKLRKRERPKGSHIITELPNV